MYLVLQTQGVGYGRTIVSTGVGMVVFEGDTEDNFDMYCKEDLMMDFLTTMSLNKSCKGITTF